MSVRRLLLAGLGAGLMAAASSIQPALAETGDAAVTAQPSEGDASSADIGDPNPTLELTPEVSFYTGDALRSFTAFGVSLTYRFSAAWWVQLEGIIGELKLDPDTTLEISNNDTFRLIDGGLVWNLPLRLGMDPDSWYADLYTSVGPGWVHAGHEDAVGGFIGGGMTVHTPTRWLGLRADLKNLFYSLHNHGGQDFNSDLEIALGPILQI